jgi:YDG domain-containing protein
MATKRILATVCLRNVIALALLALFSSVTQAQQVQLSYFKNYFVTGDYVVGGVSLANAARTVSGSTISVADSINFSGVPCTSGPGLAASVIPCTSRGGQPADVIAAFLYWQTIENTAPCSPQCGSSGNGTFNGSANTFSGVELGNPTVAACAANGAGTQTNAYARVYRADVLRFLPINSSTNVRVGNGTQTFTLTSSSTNTQFVGASLVVVYRLVTPGNPRIAPLRSVVIYDGSYTGTPGAGDLDQTMGGFYQAAKNPAARMTHMVGNGKPGFKETLTVNGSIPSGQSGAPLDGDQGPGWDVDTFNYNLAANASSVETKVVLSSDCLSWAAIITSVNVQDSDSDGIPDIGEQYGLNFNPGVRYDGVIPLPSPAPAPTPATFGTCQQYPNTCLNLPKMGANPLVPDIFVQVDWMYDLNGTSNADGSQNPPHSHNPQIAALNMVGGVFKAHGINLHFDVGSDNPLFPYCQAANSATIGPCNYQAQNSPYIVLAAYAHGGNAIDEAGTLLCPNSVTSSNCAFPGQSNLYSVLGWKFGLDAIRDGDLFLQLPQLFPQNEKDTVHYALFGHALAATTPFSTPEAGSISGIADHPGGDILVTLGLWRSDNAAFDQVGTMLEQAGTLMHELGHNLGLSHGGWFDTPNCMPNYSSVMNYLYQVAGLTDAKGNENIDYSYGLQLPLVENALSVKIPMGIQLYRVRYFGPLNSNPTSPLANTPGQASQAFCTTGFPSEPGQSYVRLEWPSISTPDWSNGTVPSGTKLGPLDINFDGTTGNNPQLITNETFFDSPDWFSLNLQQVSARPNADGFSSNAELAQVGLSQLGLSQLGLSQLGLSQLGLSQLGLSQLGLSQLGLSQLGISDPGTAALGQDQDVNAAQYHASGGGAPPTGLTASVTTNQPSPANPNPGGTGNALTWVGDPNAVAFEYNVYRCNASAVPGCTPAVVIGSNTGSPVSTAYTDFVNDFVDAGATCPGTKGGVTNTCYNTNYTYAVSEIPVLTPGVGGPESGLSNTSSMEVNHLFVIGNITPTSVTYGMANPVPTINVYGNGSVSGETCVYTTSPASTTGITPRNVTATPYSIYCSGPATTSSATDGVTYNANYLGHSPSTLTIKQAQLTITAAAETKNYDGTKNASLPLANAPTITGLQTQAGYGDSVTGLAEAYTEQPPNVGNGLTLVISAYTVNDGNGGANYNVTTNPSTATGIINRAPLTASIIGNPTKPYDSTSAATLAPANFSLSGLASGESFTVTQTVGAYNSPNVLTATTVTASLASGNFTPVGATLATNYILPTTASGPGNITPAPLTATITAANKNYDTTNVASITNCSLATVFTVDNGKVTCQVGVATFATPDAGYQLVTAAVSLMGTAASNYQLPAIATTMATIYQIPQSITFAPLANMPYGTDFNVSATATSLLPVSFSGSGSCTVTATGTVHPTNTGLCTVTANQLGNQDYLAATAVSQSFTVTTLYTSDSNLTDFTTPITTYGTFTTGTSDSNTFTLPYTPSVANIAAGLRVIGDGNEGPINVTFPSAVSKIRVFPNIDHYGLSYDGYQYNISGSNDGVNFTLLFDATSVAGSGEPFTLGTFTGSAPFSVNNVLTAGAGPGGTVGYEADFSFSQAYLYYQFGASTQAINSGNADQEITAVGALQ